MLPQLFELPSYYLSWALAALLGAAYAAFTSHRAGFRLSSTLAALVLLIAAIFAGSKLLYLVEQRLVPLNAPLSALVESALLQHGFRLPGGVLLAVPTLFVAGWMFGLPALRFADSVTPAAGIAIGCIRLGCFANGCCFGEPSSVPWAMRFPLGSVAYDWQIREHLIAWPARHTLPIEPLQLYFAAAALVTAITALRWLRTKRYDGQVLLYSCILYFGSTFALEFLRGYRLWLNVALTAVVAVSALAIAVRLRRENPSASTATPAAA